MSLFLFGDALWIVGPQVCVFLNYTRSVEFATDSSQAQETSQDNENKQVFWAQSWVALAKALNIKFNERFI